MAPPGSRGAAILAAISLVTGGVTLFVGDTVRLYTVRANWFRYVTINGGQYPYSMADRFTTFTGIVLNNGNRAVADEYSETNYVTSSTYFYSPSSMINDAQREFLRIGWQG